MSDIRNCVTWWEVVRLVSVLVQDSFCQWHSFLMPVQDDLVFRSGGQNIAWGPFGGDLEDWVRHGWQRKNVKARIINMGIHKKICYCHTFGINCDNCKFSKT